MISVFWGEVSPKLIVSFASNTKSLTRHIITFATVPQNVERQTNWSKKETWFAGKQRSPACPNPPSQHLQLDCSRGCGSFTQVWQKQADKLNWSGALNRMRPIALTRRKCNQLQSKWIFWLVTMRQSVKSMKLKYDRAEWTWTMHQIWIERVVIQTSTIQIISRTQLD